MPAGGALTAGVIGAPVVAGIIGSQQSSAARAQAQAAEQAALQNYLNINVPDPAQQAVILQQYQVTGQISPQIMQGMQQQTQLAGMQVDPASRAAEVDALNQMRNVASSGGLDAQAQQQQAQAMSAANANEAGQQGAILQNYNARGIGGSGASLAAQLSADQSSANSTASAGMNAAAGAEQRALQAMTASSQMGSQLNAQDYGQAYNAATAQDAINKFNTQNAQSAAQYNTTAANQAQAANVANQQAVANANTGVSNQQEEQNKALLQQQFQNQMTLANGKSSAENGVASTANQQANTTANQWANIGSAVGQGSAALAKSYNSNNNNSSSSSDDDDESGD